MSIKEQKRHIREEAKEPALKCTKCSARFHKPYALRRHFKLNHGDPVNVGVSMTDCFEDDNTANDDIDFHDGDPLPPMDQPTIPTLAACPETTTRSLDAAIS